MGTVVIEVGQVSGKYNLSKDRKIMCGILGMVDKNGIDQDQFCDMRDRLAHRGPDDKGMWLNRDCTIGLAQRRLSILDLSPAGHQPMSDSVEEIWITYNGEVYNFKALKAELEKKGHVFSSQTDTEVVLNAYKEWGVDCVRKFNGMFAFGIYDKRKKQIFIARDRVGKKPLYFAEYSGKFIFSSELKAITCGSDFSKQIDLRALNYYLTYGYIPFELSIYKNVRKLPPAHFMIFDVVNQEFKINRYWNVPPVDTNTYSEEDLVDELEYLIKDAVKSRLISDVPLGAFLSGGLDSSLIVGLMSGISSRNVKTFSVGFEDAKYNELTYAKKVANHFGTEHTELIVKPDTFTILRQLANHFDEPFADSSFIPTYYISKMTRNYVTVALSGDGGDELFGGYTTYSDTLRNKQLDSVPAPIRRLISKGAEYMPERMLGKRELLRLKYSPERAFIDRISNQYFSARHRKNILGADILHELGASFDEPEQSYLFQSEKDREFINTLGVRDFKTYLPEDILTKVDRMSMKASLEVRCPLLDYRVVEFSYKKIKDHLKIKGDTKKYLLKKLAQRILPKTFDFDRKKGFSIPISQWLANLGASNVEDLLLGQNCKYFDRKYIKNLIFENNNGVNHSSRILNLLIFCFWQEKEH